MSQGFESGDRIQKGQSHGAGRTVPLFADDKFGDAFIGIVLCFVVDLVAINKADDVGILLYGSRLPEVGKLGPLVGAIFKAAVEL